MGHHKKIRITLECLIKLLLFYTGTMLMILMMHFVYLKKGRKYFLNIWTIEKCYHVKLKTEKEAKNFHYFLDALIIIVRNQFLTLVYRQKTLFGPFTKYNTFTPVSYKIGLIKCLILRAFKISCSYLIFDNELCKIKCLL